MEVVLPLYTVEGVFARPFVTAEQGFNLHLLSGRYFALAYHDAVQGGAGVHAVQRTDDALSLLVRHKVQSISHTPGQAYGLHGEEVRALGLCLLSRPDSRVDGLYNLLSGCDLVCRQPTQTAVGQRAVGVETMYKRSRNLRIIETNCYHSICFCRQI